MQLLSVHVRQKRVGVHPTPAIRNMQLVFQSQQRGAGGRGGGVTLASLHDAHCWVQLEEIASNDNCPTVLC